MNRFVFTTATLGGGFAAKAEAMAAAGFRATELWARDLFDDYEGPEVALRVLCDNGLRVACFQALRNVEGCAADQRAAKFDIARRLMDLAVLAASPLVTLAANVQVGAHGETARLVDDLAKLAEEAGARGLRIAYEPIAWAPHVRSYRRALELIEAVDHPSLGLQLDVFHAWVRGEAIDLGTVPPARLFLVELCDLVAMHLPAREVSRSYRLFPGEGEAPLAGFVGDLRGLGYAGDIVVEVFNAACAAAPPHAIARRGHESLRRLMEGTVR